MMNISVERLSKGPMANDRIPVLGAGMEECGISVSDEELVERSLKGEEDAFRSLYERYRRPVYAVVCRIILDPEEARDAVQEIFVAAYRSLALWNPQRARFLRWISTIATNRAIDYWRIRRRRAEIQLPEITETHCRAAAPHVEGSLERGEQAAEVRRFLEDLPQPQRRFFILRYIDGLKLREIAERERCKIGTVKSSLHRATGILRRKLSARVRNYGDVCAERGGLGC